MATTTLKSGAIGFAYFLLFPIASVCFFILIWLGLASLLFYALTALIGVFLVKIFLGWILLRWYERRNKKHYLLDWRAGLVGPITLFLILLVPILGWFIAAMLFFIALGALMQELTTIATAQKVTDAKSITDKKGLSHKATATEGGKKK